MGTVPETKLDKKRFHILYWVVSSMCLATTKLFCLMLLNSKKRIKQGVMLASESFNNHVAIISAI